MIDGNGPLPITLPPLHIGRSVNPISTREADYANHMTTCPTRFADLPISLDRQTPVKEIAFANEPANQAPQ